MVIPDALIEYGKLVVAFLIVMDPLSLVPVLIAVGSAAEGQDMRRLVFKVVGGAAVLVLLFIVTGTWVLSLFGVSLDDLRIGGGLLLLIIALKLVMEGRIASGGEAGYRAALGPLISPLLVGPGTITAAVVFAAINGIVLTSCAAITALIISLLLFLAAPFIQRLIGDSGADLVARIMGILVGTIGVSYMRKGIMHILGSKF